MNGDDHGHEYAVTNAALPPERHRFLAHPARCDVVSSEDEEIYPAESPASVPPPPPPPRIVKGTTNTTGCTLQPHVLEDEAAANKHKLNFWCTVIHLLIGGLSPTILNLPATFHQVGYLVGFVGSFVVVLFYTHCVHMVVASERILCQRLRKASMSYWQVLYYACATGPPRSRWMAKYAKSVTYLIFGCIWGGGNSTYVLLISENVKSVLRYGCGYEATDRTIILWLSVPLVLLCWIPNLRAMVVCSVLSNTMNAASLLLVLYVVLRDFHPAAAAAAADGARTAVGAASRLPFFLSTVFLTVNGTGLVLSLKNQMKRPHTFGGTFGVVNVAYVPTGALYAVFGLLCYLRYGQHTQETVIMNLPASTFGCVVQAMYAVAITLFYPLVTYVTFDILWNEMPAAKLSRSPGKLFVVRYAAKTANALFSIVLAFVIPNISLFISLIGSVCVALDSIILPALMECLVAAPRQSLPMRLKTTVMMVMGVALMVVGCKDTYVELQSYYSG